MSTAPADRHEIATKAQSDALLLRLGETMDALTHVIEAETELVRLGKLVEAGRLQADKAELARRYVLDVQLIQANAAMLRRLSPELVESLRRRHDGFRPHLQLNMAVLATAKALAEGIVHEIAEAVARQDFPLAYNRKGNVPGTTVATSRPIMVSKSL